MYASFELAEVRVRDLIRGSGPVQTEQRKYSHQPFKNRDGNFALHRYDDIHLEQACCTLRTEPYEALYRKQSSSLEHLAHSLS